MFRAAVILFLLSVFAAFVILHAMDPMQHHPAPSVTSASASAFARAHLSNDPSPAEELKARAIWKGDGEVEEHPTSSLTTDDTRRYAAAKLIADAVLKGLNDPDSLQWDDLYTNENGTLVCAEYRARNGFNGMVRKYLSVTNTKSSDTIPDWNLNCTGRKRFFTEKYVIGKW